VSPNRTRGGAAAHLRGSIPVEDRGPQPALLDLPDRTSRTAVLLSHSAGDGPGGLIALGCV